MCRWHPADVRPSSAIANGSSHRPSLHLSAVRSSKFDRERILSRSLRRRRLVPLPRVPWRRSARGRPHERRRRTPHRRAERKEYDDGVACSRAVSRGMLNHAIPVFRHHDSRGALCVKIERMKNENEQSKAGTRQPANHGVADHFAPQSSWTDPIRSKGRSPGNSQ